MPTEEAPMQGPLPPPPRYSSHTGLFSAPPNSDLRICASPGAARPHLTRSNSRAAPWLISLLRPSLLCCENTLEAWPLSKAPTSPRHPAHAACGQGINSPTGFLLIHTAPKPRLRTVSRDSEAAFKNPGAGTGLPHVQRCMLAVFPDSSKAA